MIVEMGGAFFEKNAAAMEQRLKEQRMLQKV